MRLRNNLKRDVENYLPKMQVSLANNGHMNNYSGEEISPEKAKTLLNDLVEAISFKSEEGLKKGEVLDAMTTAASIIRLLKHPFEQNTTDAILVDFINYVGYGWCVDYALYTKDLPVHLDRHNNRHLSQPNAFV